MKTATLLKKAPTLAVVACLSYASYSIHASLAEPGAARTDLANGLEVMIKDVIHASAGEIQSVKKVMLRDPFRVAPKAAAASKASKEEPSNDSDAESLAAFVRGLTLDATFLQGQTHVAIISGRIYHQGQHLVAQGDTGKAYSPLAIARVSMHSVTLSARGKTYELGYPDQLGNRPAAGKAQGPATADGGIAEIDPEGELAFYKRLLNSPLGKLGKGVTGIGGPKRGGKRGR
jgi:hypothetical protein